MTFDPWMCGCLIRVKGSLSLWGKEFEVDILRIVREALLEEKT